MKDLFLISASPRRTDLLTRFSIDHTVVHHHYDEIENTIKNHEDYVKNQAYQKVISVKHNYSGYLLGIDTIVVLGTEIIEKPRSLDEAARHLNCLSGNIHQVLTAFYYLDTSLDKGYHAIEVNNVKFRVLKQNDIKQYINTFNVLDKAGAYGIQDCQQKFVADMQGCVFSIMGLPIRSLIPHLIHNNVC